jgi:glycosyltransferase involved in cell wall biosynthesis
MKIVRIIARLNVGGPARHVVWLTTMLTPPEFESVLITGTVPDGEEDMSYFAGEHGVEPIYIPEMSRELSPKDIVSLFKVLRQIIHLRPDIIHTHTAKAGTIGRVAGVLYRWLLWRDVKLVHTYHGHVFHSYYGGLKTGLFLFIERFLAFFSDRIIAISEQQRREINEQFGVGRASQFNVVRLGIDLAPLVASESARRDFRAELNASDDEILVGFVGRLTEIKNIPLFLAAAALVTAANVRFVVVGDGHLRESLEAEAVRLGLQKRVVFIGNRQDPGVFYAGLDIVALTSRNEGTPLSLIEAMAAGRAFVSTKVGGVVDLLGAGEVRDGIMFGERGLGVESDDAVSLAAAIDLLASDKTLRQHFENAGKTFVNENYSKERLAREIAALYREIG